MRFLSLGDLPTPHSATRNHKLKNRDPICSRSLVMQGVGITLEVKIYDLRARLEGAHGGGGDDGGGGVQGGGGGGVRQAVDEAACGGDDDSGDDDGGVDGDGVLRRRLRQGVARRRGTRLLVRRQAPAPARQASVLT